MKRLSLIALLAAALCLSSCDWFRHEDQPTDVVLFYLAANNNLAGSALEEMAEVREGWLPATASNSQVYLIYLDDGTTPKLTRVSRNESGEVVEEIVMTYSEGTDSATKETLAQVLSDAEKAYPADSRGLILWSHGTGYLPPDYYSLPTDPIIPDSQMSLQGFGYDEKSANEIELKDLRTVLERYHFRFVAFDACLLGGIEVAYELRNVCDYILASPTETLTYGFPYDLMDENFFDSDNTEKAIMACAQAYYEFYTDMDSDGTIAVYKTDELLTLADVCKDLFANHRTELANIDRTKVQRFYRSNRPYFYDLGSVMEQITTPAEYDRFKLAMSGAVIYKAATPKFLEISINEYSGLSTYIPRPEYKNLNTYYKTLAWNEATGFVQ